MKIFFEQSGGLAALRMTVDIETNELPPDQARQAEQLVEQVDYFNLPAAIPASHQQPDRFQYDIEVTDNGRLHKVTVAEQAVPASLAPLIEWLKEMARKG